MPSTTSCDFGDVILVPFPFTDQSGAKKRPAVVVSSAAYHRERQDVILMPVTSVIRASSVYGDVVLRGWQTAGLIKPSVIKPVLATIERGLVLRRLGRLEPADEAVVRTTLHAILG